MHSKHDGSVMLRISCINRSDRISGGNQFGSDTFQNGSDIIRYPTAILSPVTGNIISMVFSTWDSMFFGVCKFCKDTRVSHILHLSFVKVSFLVTKNGQAR